MSVERNLCCSIANCIVRFFIEVITAETQSNGRRRWLPFYKFTTERIKEFYVHGSVHRESMSIIVQRDATLYSLLYLCKLLYMFRVVTPPIIRSTCNCNYGIWHWSNRLCYLPLSWSRWNCRSNGSMIAEDSRDGLTSAICCNYSYMCSWWWVKLPPETCRAFYRNIINCTESLQFQRLHHSGR